VRPGPIQGEMVHPYLRRRNGKTVRKNPWNILLKKLEEDDIRKDIGLFVPLFQEQAMEKSPSFAAGLYTGRGG